ncbi:MAG: hypothetical protein QOJ59_4648 [Thermomicrobiales bacterium]|jgi:hypothetical protein|nr:hypothetical protein [Thermomicrobiales bacterium]
MLSRRNLLTGLFAVTGSPRLTRLALPATAADGTPEADIDVVATLDGTTAVDAADLAELARERTRLGAGWLAGDQRPTGVFYYIYDPESDLYEANDYNEVRHAGTTYSLYQAFGLLRDESVLKVAEDAGDWIRRSMIPVRAAGRAFLDIQNGDTSLGGQALALVALLERRRVTGETDADELILDMAKFLLWMEKEDRSGRFYFSFDHGARRKLETPDVVYYPGEALLALTRLAQQFPDGPYLEVALRAADYLVHRRDGDIPQLGRVPREDHWLTIALSELYRLNGDQSYAKVAYLQADTMISNQYTAENADPERIGGARRDSGISYTSTATKGEAIVAAWGLATFTGNKKRADRLSLGAQRNAQFQMRVQYTAENTARYVRPDRVIGGWAGSADNPAIRIDYVQHNISALIGLSHLTVDGDLPIATPLVDTET